MNSVDSRWVEREVQAAFEKEQRSPERTVLFPIRLDDAVNGDAQGLGRQCPADTTHRGFSPLEGPRFVPKGLGAIAARPEGREDGRLSGMTAESGQLLKGWHWGVPFRWHQLGLLWSLAVVKTLDPELAVACEHSKLDEGGPRSLVKIDGTIEAECPHVQCAVLLHLPKAPARWHRCASAISRSSSGRDSFEPEMPRST